ncbi:DUF4421 domain-containing protein [Algoriphagus kandeliae]|uniref:DUF4421 domain-containing protein n=1 Tax=Algoriphagus kandeliae TaxID=2562278 RepID=A0A4Y9QJ14_9BACT|nr:DUF4421 domain-containing protein [Algoriphagus kandeliae]TFV92177.1 DUF4421 domain-containing protein [Algoriphagus kandeliae]
MRLHLALFFAGIFFLSGMKGNAQTSEYDSNYVEVHPELFGLRLYFSKKYTNVAINVPDQDRRLVFRPNSGNNLGVGFTYQKFTLNIAGPLSFLNPNRQTDFPKYWDLQAHMYPKKMIIDFFGQFYDGFILSKDQLQNSDQDYLREDIKLRKYGLNVNYLFHGDKLSLQAAFNQSHIQKKSAFSPFVGFEVYGGKVTGDSLLIPTTEQLESVNFQRVNYFQFGPKVGGAGTLVFGKGFFLTGVAGINLSLGYAEWQNGSTEEKWGAFPTFFLRGFAGYNSRRFSINANYVWKNLALVQEEPFDQAINTGNYRINFVYKFGVGKSFEKKFQKFNPIRLISKD